MFPNAGKTANFVIVTFKYPYRVVNVEGGQENVQ